MNQISVKTNFTAGQVSPYIYGRGDLSIFENGARTLQNVIIHPTGGVSRRKGLKKVAALGSKGRLVSFEFNTEQTYLLCFLDKALHIYREDELVAELGSPWTIEQLANINWTQSADTLLVVHPDVAPKQICRYDNEDWKIENWQYFEDDGHIFYPFYNFYQNKEYIQPSGTSGTVNLTADNPIFSEAYVGSRIRINGGEGRITAFTNNKQMVMAVGHNLSNTNKSKDWEESAFSVLRGWPNSVTFHQDRMVIGGSKSLPNRLWLSKSSDLFNFDIGTGLDDESIEFAILSDQVNAIKNVVSTRHLLVFTTGAEWMVTGEPLTPESIQLSRQTKVGSYSRCSIPPQNLGGATTFISQSGRQLREFLFADVEQAYQARDLTLLSAEIIDNPVDCDFAQDESVLYVLLADGTVSCLTSYRTEEVNAWSKLTTQGKFVSIAVVNQEVYFIVERNSQFFLEKFAADFHVDCGLQLTVAQPQKTWSGLEAFNDMDVSVIADGFTVGSHKVQEGSLSLEEAALNVIIGLPFEHIIEPLPFMNDAARPYPPKSLRIIQGIFRLHHTRSLCLDFGSGYHEVPLKRLYHDKILDSPAMDFTGDVELNSLGWKKDIETPLWSIKSSVPAPFTLLAATIEIKTKG